MQKEVNERENTHAAPKQIKESGGVKFSSRDPDRKLDNPKEASELENRLSNHFNHIY